MKSQIHLVMLSSTVSLITSTLACCPTLVTEISSTSMWPLILSTNTDGDGTRGGGEAGGGAP